MTIIDDIKRDREAGTPGDWYVEYKHGSTRLIMPKHPDPCQMCDETYYPWVPENLSDWERIARVPQMEAALLAAEELAKATEWAANNLRGISANQRDALDAFRKALEEV